MKSSQSEWMSISDMMSGLMLIFMFIAISFMLEVQEDKVQVEESNKQLKTLMEEAKRDKKRLESSNQKLQRLMEEIDKDKQRIKDIAITYNKDKKELNRDLHKEFSKDLKRWEAEITDDNIIVFNSPTVLFDNGKSFIKKGFQDILNDFFPRYIKILSSNKYKNEIDEIRIEGHTSNDWTQDSTPQEIYLKNMTLSQSRANHVLAYCYSISSSMVQENIRWLERHFRANGMAFSKLKYMDEKKLIPDLQKSRRVEFKVQMKTEDKIYKILKAS